MSASIPIPNFDWYKQLSRESGLQPRCPFASVDRCPRYWQSLSLLGELGSSKIDPKRDAELEHHWEQSEHWPLTAEYATSISGKMDEHGQWARPILSNFCPETTFDRYGYFGSSMSKYTDEIDSDRAHERLANTHAPRNDPQWEWAHVRPMHYSECPYYSLLGTTPKQHDNGAVDVTLKIPYTADIRFKLRPRHWWERFKALMTKTVAGFPRRGSAPRL